MTLDEYYKDALPCLKQGEAYLKKLIEKYPSDTTKVSCGGNGNRKRECRWLSKIKEGNEMGFMDLA